MKREAFFALALGLSPVASADCPWTGTWVLRPAPKDPTTLSMTVEGVGPGCKLTYTMVGKDMPKTIIATLDRILKSEVDNAVDSPNGPAGKIVQYWDKR